MMALYALLKPTSAILILANWLFTLSLSKGEQAVKKLRQAQPERYCVSQPSHTENCCVLLVNFDINATVTTVVGIPGSIRYRCYGMAV